MNLDPNADRYRAAFDLAPWGIAIVDRHGVLLEANPALLAMFHTTGPEVQGRRLTDLVHPQARDRINEMIQGLGAGRADCGPAECRCLRKDGSEFRALLRCAALRDGSGEIIHRLGILEEISMHRSAETGRRRPAAQVPQVPKMETVDAPAGGIAHDLNNLLMGIQGNISLLLLDKAPDHRDVSYLKNVEKSVTQASELTRRILGLARGGKQDATAADLRPPLEKSAGISGRARREITILLVEDEEMVANIGCQMMERLGYRVIVAPTGNEALALYEAKWAEIDLVILDLVMPGMGGGAVFDRIRAINPQAAVLLSSGYTLGGQTSEIIKRGCRGFIQKPFSIEQLKRKISESLPVD
jgi:PAS domain S-box-containing protein